MSECVSASLTFGYLALRASSEKASGLSAEAKQIFRRVEAVCHHVDGVISYSGPRVAVISNLNDQVVECLTLQGDANPIPVSFASYKNAKEFITLLPINFPDPEVAIEPIDGAISLEWHFGYRKVFAISIGSSKRFAFSGINGTDRLYGVSRFEVERGEAPQVLIDGVRSLER